MNKDITFCENKDCLHKNGCRRFTGNYNNLPKRYAILTSPIEACIETNYYMLMRFRDSNETGLID